MSIFSELAQHRALSFDRATMLPLDAYRSPEVLDAEEQELFGKDWLCVGRTADIAATGDYLTAQLPLPGRRQRSVIVLRDDRGEVRAFDNVCIHRGAELLQGCGNQARITCPYHAWVYRLDGSLVGGPYMTDTTEADGRPFDPTAHQLRSLPTEVWNGFIFVSQDSTASPLAPRLAGLHEVVERYEMAGYTPVHDQVDVWATNWKLLVENFMDAYHIFKVHQNSFAANGDNTGDTTMFPGTQHWAHHRVLHEAGAELAHLTNTALVDGWRKTIVLGAVFPGFVIQLQPDWLWYLRITPMDTSHVRVAWQVAVAPEMLAAQDDPESYIANVLDLVHLVNSEDKPVVEALRRNADQPQFKRAPLSYLERNVYDFDHYVSSRLAAT